MINKVFRSKLDLLNLSLKKISVPVSTNIDYEGIVVNKPWGYEYLFFGNNCVAIWLLYIKNEHQTSMHCHPRKKTSLINISGKIKTQTLTDIFYLDEKSGIIIDNGVFHSTKSIATQGSFILEIETPPNKHDLVRLNDSYGRENAGYESVSETTNRKDSYEYYYFDGKEETKNIFGKKISIVNGESLNKIEFNKEDLVCLVEYPDIEEKFLGEIISVDIIDKLIPSIKIENSKFLTIQ